VYIEKIVFLPLISYVLFCVGISVALAADKPFKSDSPIDYRVEKNLFDLLRCKDSAVQPPKASEMSFLLDFMTTSKLLGEDVNPENYAGAAGIFWHKPISKPFPTVLRYLYNPGIPAQLLFPSSIRLTRQLPESSTLPRPVWELLAETTDAPMFYWSMEDEELTPDSFSGSYYQYKLSRLIMLLRYNNKPMLMAVSWQDNDSDSGKRGGFLDAYSNWDFVYSNKQGATASGIGWIETHIYSSASVTLLYPEEDGKSIGYSVFKWLKAGAGGFNLVRAEHITAGAERAFAGLMEVINQEHSPTPQALENMVAKVHAYNEQSLLEASYPYCRALAELSAADDILSAEDFQFLLKDGNYCRTISQDRLEALVMTNEVKRMLGKTVLGD
jgi:hypothetical protein